MRSRTHPSLEGRCKVCFLPEVLCICREFAPYPNQAEVVIVRHALERFKTSNTARWTPIALTRCRVFEHGGPSDPPLVEEAFRGAWLIFPGVEPSLPSGPLPSRLVAIDGSWSQARHMVHRLAVLRSLPRLSLAAPAPGIPRLRVQRLPAEMSTLEAIAHALAALGETEAAERVAAVHRLAVQRVSSLRRRSAMGGPGLRRNPS